jgi:hypothetical protein
LNQEKITFGAPAVRVNRNLFAMAPTEAPDLRLINFLSAKIKPLGYALAKKPATVRFAMGPIINFNLQDICITK